MRVHAQRNVRAHTHFTSLVVIHHQLTEYARQSVPTPRVGRKNDRLHVVVIDAPSSSSPTTSPSHRREDHRGIRDREAVVCDRVGPIDDDDDVRATGSGGRFFHFRKEHPRWSMHVWSYRRMHLTWWAMVCMLLSCRMRLVPWKVHFIGSFLHRQVSTEQILMMRARKDLTRRSSKTFIRSAQTGAIARAARRAAEQRIEGAAGGRIISMVFILADDA